jgi:hypothetical protein
VARRLSLTRPTAFAVSVAANLICLALNLGVVAFDLLAGRARAAGLQSLALAVPSAFLWGLYVANEYSDAWLASAAIDRQIRQTVLDKIERGEAMIDGLNEVRH